MCDDTQDNVSCEVNSATWGASPVNSISSCCHQRATSEIFNSLKVTAS